MLKNGFSLKKYLWIALRKNPEVQNSGFFKDKCLRFRRFSDPSLRHHKFPDLLFSAHRAVSGNAQYSRSQYTFIMSMFVFNFYLLCRSCFISHIHKANIKWEKGRMQTIAVAIYKWRSWFINEGFFSLFYHEKLEKTVFLPCFFTLNRWQKLP